MRCRGAAGHERARYRQIPVLNLVRRVVRRCLRFSDATTVRSWCSTTTAICDVLRRGAATDLMGEVDDAPTARSLHSPQPGESTSFDYHYYPVLHLNYHHRLITNGQRPQAYGAAGVERPEAVGEVGPRASHRANPKPHFVSDQSRKPRMVVLPREFVRRCSRGCSALRRVWMYVFAVLTLVSVSTRRSP